MKKLILLFVFGCFGLFAFAQVKKVAVYIAGSDPINNILGSRLVDGIAKSGKYVAVERTAAFVSELQKEQQYQQSGQVNDDEISRLGKQFGVNYVCVATVFDVWQEKYITTRLIDVETAEVVVTASSNGAISNSSQLLTALNTISEGLLSSFEKSKQNSARKVAVYVNKTGNKDVDIILGDQLVAGFAQSGRFFAIERTNSFISQLSKEYNYQYAGAVDDLELTRLGRQSGVQYVCVAQTDKLFGDYYISTRLINVETNEVVNSFNKEAVLLSGSQDVVNVTKEIASVLSGLTIKEKQQEAARAEERRLAEERRVAEEKRLAEERRIAEEKRKAEERRLAEEKRKREKWMYVDLGLPSGTKWQNSNQGGDMGRYTYNEAMKKFGDRLPTKKQLEELLYKCKWYWKRDGYKVVGPNGNSIFLPAAGFRHRDTGRVYQVGEYGNYWSSDPKRSKEAHFLHFTSQNSYMTCFYRDFGRSVRLVQD